MGRLQDPIANTGNEAIATKDIDSDEGKFCTLEYLFLYLIKRSNLIFFPL